MEQGDVKMEAEMALLETFEKVLLRDRKRKYFSEREKKKGKSAGGGR